MMDDEGVVGIPSDGTLVAQRGSKDDLLDPFLRYLFLMRGGYCSHPNEQLLLATFSLSIGY